MDWKFAIEMHTEALRRILVTLIAMVSETGTDPQGNRPRSVPRHLHRFVLSLLRPAESATRRLIIVAARGLAVKLPKPRAAKSERREARQNPRAMLEETREERVPRIPFFPMFDPRKRFDRKPPRRRIPEARMPQIRLLGGDDWSVPVYLRRPAPPPPPPPPTPNDPLDATRIHRRLEAVGHALDDLPRQAQRFARWKARRDARLARERAEAEDLGVTPEVLALCRARRLRAPSNITAPAKPRSFRRIELMRPGRPPGWRKRPTHEVHEVLNDLHGLAVWARDGP
jgi:hypothetical protein